MYLVFQRAFLFIFLVLLSWFGQSQSISKDSIVVNCTKDSVPETDAIEIIDKILHPNKRIDSLEFERKSKRKFQFSVLPGLGYTLQSSFVANVSGNVVFRNGNNNATNLSAIISGISYTAKKQLLFYIQSDIWTKNNDWNLISDIRYYQYPQNSYGLGGYTKETDAFLVDYSFLRLYGTAYRKIQSEFYIGLGFMLDKHWRITQDKTTATDFDVYGFNTVSTSSGISLNILSDTRDNPINALKGYYANAFVRFNHTAFGSDNNWTGVVVDFRKYVRVGKRKNVIGFWNYNWLTLQGTAPYLDLPSTAWDPFNNLGRGYTQSRFRSPDLIYLESEFRFNITRNQLIGGVAFINAQSYSEYPSKRFEKILPAFGSGIRIKFNKFSRTNLAIDYGIGLNGSGGIFVNLGEVF